MTKVILIEDNIIFSDLIATNLITFFDADIIKKSNASALLEHPGPLSETNLIICADKIGNENTTQIIQKYLIDNNLDIKLLTIESNDRKEWDKIIPQAAKILGITDDVLSQKATPDFVPITLNYFNNLDSVNCDVFIRIKKTPIEYQLVQ